MPVVPLKDIVDRAFAERYGVPAINIVNDLTLEAVLAAAVQERSPLIVQTSVKTVRSIGLDLLQAMWRELKTAHSSAHSRKMARGLPTTGKIPSTCGAS